MAQFVTMAGINVWQRGLTGPWEPVTSGPVPACAALESDGGRRWPGRVLWQNDNTPGRGRDMTYCTWLFNDPDGGWTSFGHARVEITTHRGQPTRSAVPVAANRYRYDRDAMVAPVPRRATTSTWSMWVLIDASSPTRANVTLRVRLFHIGQIPPAQEAAAFIAAETLHGICLRPGVDPMPDLIGRGR